jgi:hypothetical protein
MQKTIEELEKRNEDLKKQLNLTGSILRDLMGIVSKATMSFESDLIELMPRARKCIDDTEVELRR